MGNYDCYNIGFKYLQDKYGVKRLSLTCGFYKRIQRLPIKKYLKAIEDATDNDYNTTYKLPDDAPIEDKEIDLLLGQYYGGSAPQRELLQILVRLKVIEVL